MDFWKRSSIPISGLMDLCSTGLSKPFATMRIPARAIANGGAGILAILDYLDVRGRDVIVPANTFWATPQAVKKAGGRVIYADCNREDLCLSLEDLQRKVTPKTKAVILVHIGGHLAFQAEEIAAFCREREIALVEDCAHVHGGWWNGKTGGHFGFAGAYSFYATKTMPLGEGGMVVSRDAGVLELAGAVPQLRERDPVWPGNLSPEEWLQLPDERFYRRFGNHPTAATAGNSRLEARSGGQVRSNF